MNTLKDQDIKQENGHISQQPQQAQQQQPDPAKEAKKKAKELVNLEKKKKLEAKLAKQMQEKEAQSQTKSKKQIEKEEKLKQRKEEELELGKLVQQMQQIPAGQKKDTKELYKSYQPRLVETGWYSWWRQQDYFKASQESSKPNFTIVIPPPNITGSLHIGHCIVLSLQDCLIRYFKMKGYNSLWLPGTDHAGIATQVVVERKIKREQNLSRHDLGRQKFLDEVWQWKEKHGNQITEQFTRLGCSLDWSRECFTLDETRQLAVVEAFNRLFQQGLIYRDNRLVNWSCQLKTAISDIEVDYEDIEPFTKRKVPGYEELVEFGVLSEFAYKLEDGSGEIVVATTRLETMIGDTGVAVHPKDERYKHLHGKKVVHPIPDQNGDLRKIPIILDAELVDMDFGTGAVKITPAHDPNDFNTGKKHNLEFITVFSDQGLINDRGGELFKGMPRFKARIEVEKYLSDKNLFRGKQANAMRLGICSRSKDVVEPMLKPQWWVNCKTMAARSVDAVKKGDMRIIPSDFEKVWFQWLENIRDWCISRQLWWGHQVPAYYVIFENESIEKCGKPGMASELSERWIVGRSMEEARENAIKKFGTDKFKLIQDEDVLDTWFSSGLFPLSTLGWPQDTVDFKKFYPTQTLVTGHDIIFFWVARMVMLGLQLTGEVPFKTVYLSPIIRDAHGRKMSKSLGNVVNPLNVVEGVSLEKLQQDLFQWNLDPKEVQFAQEGQKQDYPDGIEECGTDALRFALINYTNQGRDINLDIKRVVAYRHWCNKIWNAIKFGQQKLGNFTIQDGVQERELLEKEYPDYPVHCKWVLSRLNYAIDQVNKNFEQYNFYGASQAVYVFLYDDVCNLFLETIKPTFNHDQNKADKDPTSREFQYYYSSQCKKFSQTTLYICLEYGLRLLHPFMPYLTEDVWQKLPNRRCESISQCEFPQSNPKHYNQDLEKSFEYIQKIISDFRSLKVDFSIPSKDTPDGIIQCKDNKLLNQMQQLRFQIRTLAQLDTVQLTKEDLSFPIQKEVDTHTKIFMNKQ